MHGGGGSGLWGELAKVKETNESLVADNRTVREEVELLSQQLEMRRSFYQQLEQERQAMRERQEAIEEHQPPARRQFTGRTTDFAAERAFYDQQRVMSKRNAVPCHGGRGGFRETRFRGS